MQVGGSAIVSYEYNEYNGKLKKLTYANGLVEEYVYNALEMLEEVWYTVDGNKTLAYKYSYSSNGALIEFENCLTGDITRYTYSAEDIHPRQAIPILIGDITTTRIWVCITLCQGIMTLIPVDLFLLTDTFPPVKV